MVKPRSLVASVGSNENQSARKAESTREKCLISKVVAEEGRRRNFVVPSIFSVM